MLNDVDRQRLQAGFDGELTPREWQRVREEFADCAEAAAYLAELEALRDTLAAAPEIPVPEDLAARIKQRIDSSGEQRGTRNVAGVAGAVTPVDFRTRSRGRPAVNLAGGLALAASLVLAVGLGVQFLGVSDLGRDSQMRSRMTGTLLDPAAYRVQDHWQWPGGDARATLLPGANGLTLELQLTSSTPVELLLEVSGDQWRWRQDATSVPYSDGQRAADGQLRLAVDARGVQQRYRFQLEPLTRDGNPAQGASRPLVEVTVLQDGEVLRQAAIAPGARPPQG